MIKMSRKYILAQLRNMRAKYYKVPTYNPKSQRQKILFQYDSLQRSAMNEIIDYLTEIPWDDVIENLEDFRSKMDDQACKAKTSESSYLYSVYYDVATNVLDEVLFLKNRERFTCT